MVFGAPTITDAEIAEEVDSLRSGWIGTGPKVARFERMLEDYLGVEHVRCVSSCTAALFLSMQVLGVGPGDEVLVPAMTFVASANAIEHTGATPVLVDSEPDTGLMDLVAAEAIDHPPDQGDHAGAPRGPAERPRQDRRAPRTATACSSSRTVPTPSGRSSQPQDGGHGNPTAFSFYVTKNISTGEGGADRDRRPIRRGGGRAPCPARPQPRRVEALLRPRLPPFDVVKPGFKYNLTDIAAAMGLHQLPRLDGWIARRAELSRRYDDLLADLPVDTTRHRMRGPPRAPSLPR